VAEAKGMFLCWGSAACSKNIGQGPIKWLLLGEKTKQKKKNTLGAPIANNFA